MDILTFLTIIATGAAVFGLTYSVLRNFKNDVNGHIDKLEKRINTIDERMFWIATGKKLEDAILEEKMKKVE